MRIISSNMCKECCYCIEDYDENGLCCKDMDYKPVKLNQSACRFFCDDNNGYNSYANGDINEDDILLFDEENDFDDL